MCLILSKFIHPQGDDPRGCLARAVDWRFFQRDGKWFARETNTMPQVLSKFIAQCVVHYIYFKTLKN